MPVFILRRISTTFLNEHELKLSKQQGTPYFDLFEAIKSDRKSLGKPMLAAAGFYSWAGALLGFY